ncbi:MAG TPA: SAP domain-containing protein [Streptosporangiaceae bacterium]|jgi:hypothetical protein
MPTTTKPYAVAASQARTAVERTADIWAQGARTLTGILPGIPQLDLVPAVERYFDFVQHTVEVNRDFALRWARAASSVSGTAHGQAETAKQVTREKAEQVSERAKEKAATAEHDLVTEAHRVERERARREYASARARYQSMTKADLSDQLGQRDLPKTGDKEELLERLVEADTGDNVVTRERRATRETAKREQASARARYQSMTKADLSDQLGQRDLPKTGDKDELVERLVEADA